MLNMSLSLSLSFLLLDTLLLLTETTIGFLFSPLVFIFREEYKYICAYNEKSHFESLKIPRERVDGINEC